jgi:hypothetical protein
MSLAETLDLLVKAREYVAEGEEYLVDQREVVDRLERKGQDTPEATLFLEGLEEIQEEYVAHRDRLERKVMRLVRPES